MKGVCNAATESKILPNQVVYNTNHTILKVESLKFNKITYDLPSDWVFSYIQRKVCFTL